MGVGARTSRKRQQLQLNASEAGSPGMRFTGDREISRLSVGEIAPRSLKPMRVLLTGMSGTGKSALVHELRQRGYEAHDADEGFAEPRVDGRWGWRVDLIAELLAGAPDRLLFFAGCSDEQAGLPFDYRVLLTAPRSVLVQRLRTRCSNSYGRDEQELSQVLADLVEVEPLLRRSADLVLMSTAPATEIADVLLRRISEL